MSIATDGLRWSSGSKLAPRHAFEGSLSIPWQAIESVDLGLVPGAFKWAGGYLVIERTAGAGNISGEFLGSSKTLRRAMELALRDSKRDA